VHVPGVYVMPEPNDYRPYIKGLSGEESALACLELGLKMYDMASTGRRAAIIIEPIISAGGVLVPPKSYMQALRKAADERGIKRRPPLAGSATATPRTSSAWCRTS
jgi:2,2-dialkylglycine decarboxylase (pyruvate)